MKSDHKNRWVPSIIRGAFFVTVLVFLNVTSSAVKSGDDIATEQVGEGQIPLVEYFENQEFSGIAEQIRTEYLSHNFVPNEGRDLALAIVTYIGPSVISKGRFVPPQGFYISPGQLEYMTGRFFPEEGCRVERIWFATEGDYYVLLVDASDHPSPEYIEECLLLATLTALGERMGETEVQPVHVLRNRILEIVGEPP